MMRKTPFLLGALGALACSFACFACGGATGPSEPVPSSQSPAAGGGSGAGGTAGGGAAGGANATGGGAAGAGQGQGQATGTAPVSGSFGGSYRVPTTPDLAAAATFDVTELTWTMTGNVATLAYNLPRALVGKVVRVVFTGPFDPATGQATLSGLPGTSVCTVTSVDITCSETMQGLMPVNPDLNVVAKLAAGYPGPVADRTSLAQQFAGDPIGIARLDLSRPGVPEPIETELGSGKGKP